MTYTPEQFLKIIHDTQAVKIWDHSKGPVFWYAASVPGPFYVNTEFVLGADLAAGLLEKINWILSSTEDLAARAEKLNTLILSAYEKDQNYRQIIETLVAEAKKKFAGTGFTIVSGGERRDWLFSIPFAKLYGIKHLFIFKNKSVFCEGGLSGNEKALHVADLINNAASYFDAWFPALQAAKVPCVGTICVNSRGTNGVQRLKEAGQKVVAINSINVDFFEKSQAAGLISEATLEEIRVYFKSAKEWASKYLLNGDDCMHLFDVQHVDPKSFERLVNFFTKDPWEMRAGHEAFFAAMDKAIAARKAS